MPENESPTPPGNAPDNPHQYATIAFRMFVNSVEKLWTLPRTVVSTGTAPHFLLVNQVSLHYTNDPVPGPPPTTFTVNNVEVEVKWNCLNPNANQEVPIYGWQIRGTGKFTDDTITMGAQFAHTRTSTTVYTTGWKTFTGLSAACGDLHDIDDYPGDAVGTFGIEAPPVIDD